MKLKTIAGPFSETEAKETAKYLGEANHSAYYNSSDEWFVEVDLDIIPDRLFGIGWNKIQSLQQKR